MVPLLRLLPAVTLALVAAPPAWSQAGRAPAAASGTAATVSLDQLSIAIAGESDETVLKQKVAMFRDAMRMIRSCADVPGVAKDLGAEVTTNRSVPVSALPPKLSELLATMPIGTATPLFGEAGKYVRSVVLCGRGPS